MPATEPMTAGWPKHQMPPAGARNVVVVLLDDVGFAHLGCYGSDISTPNMDALAARGVKYRNFHTTALCSPTRASLLTGRSPHSVGVGMVAGYANGYPGYVGEISRSAGTVAEILRGVGYSTIAAGKWHLTPLSDISPSGPYTQWPLGRGFDQYYGFLGASTDQYTPDLVRGSSFVEPPAREGYHLTEDLIDNVIQMISSCRASDPQRPVFTYLALGAAHSPLQAPAEYIERYRGQFDDGWDAARERVYRRQLELGVIPEGTELAPRNPDVRPWDEIPADEKRLYARMQEVFAGFLEHTDDQLGRLFDYIEAAGMSEDTVVFLMSDNGASAEGGASGRSEMLWVEDVAFDPLVLLPHIDELGGPAHHTHYPTGWAMVGNTPLKLYKRHTYGGGIRGPLIVAGAIPEGAGGWRSQYHHVSDILPTILELCGVKAPDSIAGVAQIPIEGTSLAYSLGDPSAADQKPYQHYEMHGNRAIWRDGMKAVAMHRPGTPFDQDRWELYDTRTDFSEVHNLTDDGNDDARTQLDALVSRWWEVAREHQVLPLDDRIQGRRLQDLYRRRLGYPRRVRLSRGARIPAMMAPGSPGLPARVEAEVQDVGPSTEGVVVALGGRFGGYTLFVQDGRLRFECGYYLQPRFQVQSTDLLPERCHSLGFVCEKEDNGLRLHLTVNGAPASSGLSFRPVPVVHNGVEPFEIGRDGLSPVSPDYASPFEFTGTIRAVDVEVADDWPDDLVTDLDLEAVLTFE
ncbi:arylsulfatase [Dactylosporangium roseum]|uniref:Arylsulfatase n=1 Tax=Dactylosporangium roseum TaxID=47989 RepID=A0ABY5YXK7_9ACTN|nr:arylsulfatase [Dactylosporangium roseum]UWZ34479.1 arylsulfatase [Dactylosporangium roseum]